MENLKWEAWIDLMPPKPDDLHVSGEVMVSNSGVQVELSERTPQGINPNILLLNLRVEQRPGMWPQVMTKVPCRYHKVLDSNSPRYTKVMIFHEDDSYDEVEVKEVN